MRRMNITPVNSRQRRDKSRRRPAALYAVLLACAALLLASPEAAAQLILDDPPMIHLSREARLAAPLREGLPERRGGFTFCRLFYTSVRREPSGLGWSTDYPSGDNNLMVRLGHLTTTDLSRWDDGQAGHAVVRATDPELFQCPFLFASDVGTVGFSNAEAESLREFFQKGGFLWVDDFWGFRAWEQWTAEIGRILPEHQIVELTPEHPLFTLVYHVDEVPQIPNIQFWRRSGGRTDERGAETPRAELHAIFDERDRLVVLMTHNTDIADGWEREGESDEFFRIFSPRAYGLAVNIIMWVLTR